jgi:hypothetical protein
MLFRPWNVFCTFTLAYIIIIIIIIISELCHGFPHSLQANDAMVPRTKPWRYLLIPSNSLITVPYNIS